MTMTTATKPKTVIVTSQYGRLSRGRHSARQGKGDAAQWAPTDAQGNLLLTAGTWNLHCTDGFNRTARAVITVKPNGAWEMSGDSSRFDVVK